MSAARTAPNLLNRKDLTMRATLLMLTVLLLSGCDLPPQCARSADCDAGERCLAMQCIPDRGRPGGGEGEGGADEPLLCEAEAGEVPGVPDDAFDLAERESLEFGAPVRWRELVAADLDGGDDGGVETVVVRGGRVEVHGADDRVWWQSEVLGAHHVQGVFDLDGDGPQEVVVSTTTGVAIFAGLTGELLWRLPQPLTAVHRVMVADVDADGLPDLYVADRGCGSGGTGDGYFHGFAGGFGGDTLLSAVNEPRCARFQTLADLDGDGRPELVAPDATGVHAYDPADGDRVFCGDVEPGNNGVLSTFVVDADDSPGDELVVMRQNRISVLDLVDGRTAPCAAEQSLQTVAQVAFDAGVELRGEGSALVDLDGDGELELVTSGWFPAFDAWCTLGYELNGRNLFILEDATLLAARDIDGDDRAELLLASGQGRRLERHAPVSVYSRGVRLAPHTDRGAVLTDWVTATATAFSPDLAPPAAFPSAFLLLVDHLAPFDVPEQLHILPVNGGARRIALGGMPGGAHRIADPANAGAELLALAHADGGISLHDEALQVVGGSDAPTGAGQLVATDPGVVAYSVAGELGGVRLDDALQVRWRTPLGVDGRRPQAALPAPVSLGDAVLARDHRDATRQGWALVDAADGEILTELGYDSADYRTLAAAVVGQGDDALLLTYDNYIGVDRFVADAGDRVVGDLFAADPACDARPVYPRAVTAWARNGERAWRTVMRPNTSCGGPAGQTLTVHDGVAYVTESNAIRALDGATGAVLGRTDLGRFDAERDRSTSPRGGGRVLRVGDRLLRVGGNGPVDAFDLELNLVWRAENPEGVSRQGWVARPAAVLGDELWVSPGPDQPVYRYGVGDGALRGRVWLRGGEVGEAAGTANVVGIRRVGELLTVSADDGWLYAFTEDGALRGALRRDAVPGGALVADVDGDGSDELLLPEGDGVVTVFDRAELAAPSAAWDVACPPSAELCGPEHDIDETAQTEELCAMWWAVPDATTYDTRILGPRGAVVRPWAVRGDETFSDNVGLGLMPGSRYTVQVRAWRLEDGEVRFSEIASTTDGVWVRNPSPPEVTRFEATPNPVPAGARTTIVLEANDDDRIAGWSLAVHDDDGLVVRLVRGALAHQRFRGEHTWDGTDGDGNRLVGDFTLVARVVDRAGSATEARHEVTLR